jgi:hypothetical protein
VGSIDRERYTNIITFVALVIAAGNLLDFWGISTVWKDIMFVIFPVVLGLINSRGVKVRKTGGAFVSAAANAYFPLAVWRYRVCGRGAEGDIPHGNLPSDAGYQRRR